ncbi:hypothetical protein MBANPS3_002365 [Mucor bainieri]
MHTYLLITAAIAAVVAATVESHQQDGSDQILIFQLEKRNGTTAAIISTPDRIRHTLAKFDLKASYDTDYQTSSNIIDHDTAPVVDLNTAMMGIEYIGRIHIGNPPQEFHLNFDTGSADIWVPASDCHRCGGQRHYESSLSGSFRTETSENGTWQVRYGDGSGVSGDIGHDTITLGNDISLDNYPFGIAKEQAHGFARDPFMDGLFGLAFPALSAISNKTSFVQELHKQGKIKEPLVSFWFGRSTADKKDSTRQGEVMFGGVNADYFNGHLAYIPVEQPLFWKVPVRGVSINGQSIYDKAGSAILDTGTTLLVMPTAVSRKIHEAIPGASFDALYGWRMPCDSATTATKDIAFTITLGEHDFSLAAADLVRESVEAGNGLCYSGIAESQSPMFILGDTFLKKYYSVYDYGNMRVGLAPSSY